METTDKPKSLLPVVVIGIVLIFLFALGVKLLLAAGGPPPDEDAARAAERSKALEDLNKENTQKLGGYAWVDKAKGQVQIPIDKAVQLAIVELNARPPAPAGPIATPAPSPAAAAPESSPAAAQPAASPAASPAAQPAPAN